MAYSEYRKRVLPVINNNPVAALEHVRVSNNGKTGISINLSIVETCQPTKECMSYCYGMRGPIGFKNSLLSQHANTLRFKVLETSSQNEVNKEALNIAKEIDKSKKNWIRWNGVGDLIPGSVRVINALSNLRPDIVQWVVTRKVEEVKNLLDSKAIKVLFSVDTSTPPQILERAKILKRSFKKAKFRFSWTRRDETIPPKFVHIVFNEHRGRKRGNWNDDSRVCEATLPEKPHEDICNSCRRCFA
jgi:hypothetical protein